MSIYSAAPQPLSWANTKPTLLVCWWATLFCTAIILLRVVGRFIRSERLFAEDKMAFYCLIPLYIRMALVQVILTYGTNNNDFSGATLTQEQLRRRTIGSGLALASRIFYSATLWMLKNTILEFFKRLSGLTWSRAYQNAVLAVRCILVATFIAIVISDLVECQPFNHYWQVVPDPGGRCRQGYVNLLTTGVCNVFTDLLLVLLPVPIIIMSQMSFKRKLQLVLLFSLSLLVVGLTLYRIPQVIESHGSQQLRSLLASVELIIATGVANALVLGSFVRDKGVKKRRFKYGSVAAESVNGTDSGNRSRRPTCAEQAWGSDEDLVRDVGYGVHQDLRQHETRSGASAMMPAGPVKPHKSFNLENWNFPERTGAPRASGNGLHLSPTSQSPPVDQSSGPKRVAFFDVGGLLEDDSSGSPSTARRQSTVSSREPLSPTGLPRPVLPASGTGLRRGSQALLQDLGGLLTPFRTGRDAHHHSRGRRSLRSVERDGSGTELRDMSPAVSPCTEVPPPPPLPSDPPPYEIPAARTSEEIGGIKRSATAGGDDLSSPGHALSRSW